MARPVRDCAIPGCGPKPITGRGLGRMIRGYLHRGRIAYRAPTEAKRIRLGDLLAVVVDEGERKSA